MRDGVCQWDGEGCNITVTIGGDWGGCGAFSAKPAAGGPTGRAADKFYLYNVVGNEGKVAVGRATGGEIF